MSLPLFLVPALPPSGRFVLDGPEGHHASVVQRLRVGESVLLGDGVGGTATAEVRAVGKGTLTVEVRSRRYDQPYPQRLVVVQGIPKGDRGELAVQAMTEVGVDEIVPWSAARCVAVWRGERGEKSRDKWAATAREAAKQARRSWLPTVAAAASTAAVAAVASSAGTVLVLHEEASARLSTVELPASGDIVLVVGPEGGIADDEVAAFVGAGASTVRLGPTVLRTSTAGVAALCVLATRLGRF
jgi:16S rRNA (uracil1498-N3)-methyltransferase